MLFGCNVEVYKNGRKHPTNHTEQSPCLNPDNTSRSSREVLATNHGSCFFPRQASPDLGHAAGSVGLGRAGLLHRRHLQLRGLHRRHRQPPPRGPRGLLLLHRQLPLRPDVPEAHRPLLRRPPHHRLLRDGAQPAADQPVPGQERRLQRRRQLRGGRRDGARPRVPPAERDHHAAGEHAAQLPARLVQIAPQRHVPGRLWEEAGRSLVLGRGDRRERLQLRVLSEEVHGGRQGVRATGRQEHHGRRKGGDRAGSDPDHHPGELPDRVLAELPLPLLRRRLHGPRRAGLPQELQRLRRVPQRAAPGGHRRPPEGQCRRLRRLRRLLRRLPAPPRPRRRPRVRRGVAAEGVLRRGRGVQLRHGHDVRRARGEHVRRPGTPRELGRHPPHPAGLQGHGAVDPHGRVRPACRKRAGHMELLMIKEARTRCSSTTSLASSSMGCLPSVCLRVANANSNFVSLGKGGYTPALCI